MVFSLLTSLVLAVTFTPALASLLLRRRPGVIQEELEQGGPILRIFITLYEVVARFALRWWGATLVFICVFPLGAVWLYNHLETGFLPDMDEGPFVLDYFTRPGTSL